MICWRQMTITASSTTITIDWDNTGGVWNLNAAD